MLLKFVAAIVIGSLISEVAGYCLHRLLHSGALGRLSRAHLHHHNVDFPPGSKQRAERYTSGAVGRFNLGGVGIEWLLPIALILCALHSTMYIMGVSLLLQSVVTISAVLWAIFALNYMHSMMHLRSNAFLTNRLTRAWFKRARRLHDIHHTHTGASGSMDCNYGIVVFFLDRAFGTFRMTTRH